MLCLFSASLLWVYVSASQNSVGKFPSSLKIKAINNPAGLVAIYDVKTVNIKIMAEPSVWRKLSADSFSAYVDLSGLAVGTYELPVNVVSAVPGVQIVERDPDRIFISLEPIVLKEVNINRRIEGSAAEGLVAGNIELVPDQVQVKGPKSLVENLTEATALITLNGESEDFEKMVNIISYDETGEIVRDVEFIPGEVRAKVPIVKASNNKTVGIKVKVIGTPKVGYYVSNIVVTPNVVDITGSRSVVTGVNYVETFGVDIANATADVEAEVALDTGGGIALQAGTPAKVRVRVAVSPTEITREMVVKVATEGLDPAYKVSLITPVEVRVVCSGPAESINALRPDDVVFALNLQNRGAGIFNFDIVASAIKVPAGVTVTSVLPSVVSVTVEKR